MKKTVKSKKKALLTKILALKLFPRNLIKELSRNKDAVSNDIQASILKESVSVIL